MKARFEKDNVIEEYTLLETEPSKPYLKLNDYYLELTTENSDSKFNFNGFKIKTSTGTDPGDTGYGENLIPFFTDSSWTYNSTTVFTITDSKLTIIPNGTAVRKATLNLAAKANATYRLSYLRSESNTDGSKGFVRITSVDDNKILDVSNERISDDVVRTITTTANTTNITVLLSYSDSNGIYTFENLELREVL